MKPKDLVSVSLFGNFSISYCEKTLAEPTSAKESQPWQLLKYLILNHERSVPVDELFRVLSFREGDEIHEGILRVRLCRSRSLLNAIGLGDPGNGLLLTSNNRYLVNPEYRIQLDSENVDRALLLCQRTELAAEERLLFCMDALNCCKGKFLELTGGSFAWIATLQTHYRDAFRQLCFRTFELMGQVNDYSDIEVLFSVAANELPEDTKLHSYILRQLTVAQCYCEAATFYAKLALCYAASGRTLPEFSELIKS